MDYDIIIQNIEAGKYSEADNTKFDDDVVEALGLTGHPKAAKLMEIAEELACGHGLEEVLSYACLLSDLLQRKDMPDLGDLGNALVEELDIDPDDVRDGFALDLSPEELDPK